MATFPGHRLEDYIEDAFVCPLSPENIATLAKIFESWRESCESQLGRFKYEEQSWRDYRNAMWGTIPVELREKADAFLESLAPVHKVFVRPAVRTFDEHVKQENLYVAYSGFIAHVACQDCKKIVSLFGDAEVVKYRCSCKTDPKMK